MGNFEPGRFIEFERVADYWAKDLPVNVGINNSAPQSRLQIGAPSTSWGDYLQVPMVSNTDLHPPAGDCNNTTLVGRLVLQTNKNKTTFWACTSAGSWKALATK